MLTGIVCGERWSGLGNCTSNYTPNYGAAARVCSIPPEGE